MGTAWDNFNKTGKIITKTSAGNKSAWDSYNATVPARTVKPKFGEAPKYVNGHPNSPVFKDYQPSTAGTITAAPERFLQGVSFNKPSTGLPLVTVSDEGPSLHPKPESNQLVKQGAAAINSVLGSIFRTASSWDTVLQNEITNASASQKLGGLATAGMETAMTFIPAFAIANASLAASREITVPDFVPVIGGSQPFAKAQDLVFGGLTKAGDAVISKAYDELNVDPVVRANTEKPLADIINLAAQMAIFHKAGDVLGKTGEFAAKKTGATEATQVLIGNAAKRAVDFAMDPYAPVFNGFKVGIVGRLEKFKKSGVPLTDDIVRNAVGETAKEVEIPKDEGVMTLPTPGGDVVIHTENRTVLENMRKDGESLNFKRVGEMGTDAKGDPIQARFTWDFGKKSGTFEVIDAQTAVEISHGIGQRKPATLRDALSQRLDGVLPEYGTNKVAVDRMITDLAVGNLKGNATVAEIHAEAVRIADTLAREANASKNAGERRATNKPVVDALSTLASGKNTPTMEKLVKLANGEPVYKKESEPKVEQEIAEAPVPSREKQVIARLDQKLKEFRDQPTHPTQLEYKNKQIKAMGMAFSAIKRAILGTPTQIEIANATKYLRGNRIGKEVTVDGRQGVIDSAPSFGRFAVKFKDGTRETVPAEKIVSKPVTHEEVLAYIKEDGMKKAMSETRMEEADFKEPTRTKEETVVEESISEIVPEPETKAKETEPEPPVPETKKEETVSEEVLPEKTQPTKVASDISKSLVAKGMEQLPPEAQAKYSPIEKKDQIERVASIIEADYAKAREMALGKEPVPNDVHPQVLFNAVKNMAEAKGDVQTLIDLAGSPIATARSEAAQTLGASGFNNKGGDAFEYIAEVAKSRKVDRTSLASFIDKIKC